MAEHVHVVLTDEQIEKIADKVFDRIYLSEARAQKILPLFSLVARARTTRTASDPRGS